MPALPMPAMNIGENLFMVWGFLKILLALIVGGGIFYLVISEVFFKIKVVGVEIVGGTQKIFFDKARIIHAQYAPKIVLKKRRIRLPAPDFKCYRTFEKGLTDLFVNKLLFVAQSADAGVAYKPIRDIEVKGVKKFIGDVKSGAKKVLRIKDPIDDHNFKVVENLNVDLGLSCVDQDMMQWYTLDSKEQADTLRKAGFWEKYHHIIEISIVMTAFALIFVMFLIVANKFEAVGNIEVTHQLVSAAMGGA